MLNITVETHPNILSAAVVLGDNLYSEALHAESNKDLCRRFIQKIYNEGETSSGWRTSSTCTGTRFRISVTRFRTRSPRATGW
jgi:hypothetical protein